MPAFSGSSLERDSRAAGTALFSLRIDQGNKGREIIGCIVTVLVKMLSFDNTLGPMIRLTRLSFTHVVDQIASVSVHQLQVDVVVVTLEAFMVMLRCW
ncbi:hypothetical protein F2Q69_00057208 [Brassica cretica]|uniref:Uncharacterized protein n=1 Tax=Brassica cretica TaxID=69181 RepID=A0A8S9N0P1_BRACR|nr:hypothetical protein F2Q69_00057208 [Brassica cretica]